MERQSGREGEAERGWEGGGGGGGEGGSEIDVGALGTLAPLTIPCLPILFLLPVLQQNQSSLNFMQERKSHIHICYLPESRQTFQHPANVPGNALIRLQVVTLCKDILKRPYMFDS